jgi:hypothetical protein
LKSARAPGSKTRNRGGFVNKNIVPSALNVQNFLLACRQLAYRNSPTRTRGNRDYQCHLSVLSFSPEY